jgi:hypothetical protein
MIGRKFWSEKKYTVHYPRTMLYFARQSGEYTISVLLGFLHYGYDLLEVRGDV